MMDPALHIGVDIGGTNIKVGLIDDHGAILSHKRITTAAHREKDAIFHSIIEAIDAVLSQASVSRDAVADIGLGVPGTADAANGTVVYAPNLFWRNVDVRSPLDAVFHRPVHIAQDTRAATWAEYLVGAAQGMRSVAGVTLGTGVGCGMVFDGKIFHGGMNTAGEFGHQIVEVNGAACNCGRTGCLEAHAGGLAILRQARREITGLDRLVQKPGEDIGVDDIYRLADRGHQQAVELARRVVSYIGVGLVNLINLNSVEMICLSGGISSAPAHLLLDPLTAFVRANVYSAVADRVCICRSALGEDAPLIGAALLYRSLPYAA